MAIGCHQHPGHRRSEAEPGTNLVFFRKFVLKFTKLTSTFIYFYQSNLRGLCKSIDLIFWYGFCLKPESYCRIEFLSLKIVQKYFV
jgi:hypothetical protein